MSLAKIRLAVFACLYLGWLTWLGYASFQRGSVPILSRAQLLASTHLIVGEVTPDNQGIPSRQVRVVESVSGSAAPASGQTIDIIDLAAARIPIEMPTQATTIPPGEYLLPVVRLSENRYRLAGLPRSPGLEASTPDRPLIYPWTDSIRAQLQTLGLLP